MDNNQMFSERLEEILPETWSKMKENVSQRGGILRADQTALSALVMLLLESHLFVFRNSDLQSLLLSHNSFIFPGLSRQHISDKKQPSGN